jgi:aminodeoxyfutalosine synthase
MWLKVHRLAHELGMHTNATMLYGHIESAEDRVDHLLQLRKLQDETHGFQTYIPLAFHPANTELGKLVQHDETSGFMDLKNVAVARLLLDNFPHIKAYWIMMTPAPRLRRP